MRLTDTWLRMRYVVLNAKWFDGHLPASFEIEVRFADTKTHGAMWYAYEDGTYGIYVPKGLARLGMRDASCIHLLHEMAHHRCERLGYWGHVDHDQMFKLEIERLKSAGAFDPYL
jgi:hypothetical protein